jgi:hypothetical protein
MRRILGWMAVVILCRWVGTAVAEEPADARLQEAQTAFDEAKQLHNAGKYADAAARAEHALALREAALGGAHPEVARSLHLLGAIYLARGQFARVETEPAPPPRLGALHRAGP